MNIYIKSKIIICFLLINGTLFAQEGRMGVGTEDPTRTLHIEGSLRVNGFLEDKVGSHTKMLVTDNLGNIDYANLWTVIPTRKRVWHLQYESAGDSQKADGTKILTAGRFEFRFDKIDNDKDHTGRFEFRLSEKPSSNVNIYLNFEENWAVDGFQYTAKTEPKVFTTQNWNVWQHPVTFEQAQFAAGEMNELFISYPGENAFYRLLIYRMKTADKKSTWIITAEEFGS